MATFEIKLSGWILEVLSGFIFYNRGRTFMDQRYS